jgi:hypothetical protein
MYQETVNERLVNCITESLDTMMGESVTQVILYNFKNRTNLSIQDIPLRPKEFSRYLDSMFGVQGSSLVKQIIVDGIRANFDIQEISNPSLEYVISATARSNLSR